MAIVDRGRHGLTIGAINAAAFASGIRPGQTLADARAILPHLKTVPGNPAADAGLLTRLAEALGRYGPNRNVETGTAAEEAGVDAPDRGLWVDITGVAHLYGGEAALARDGLRRLARQGFSARIAIADTHAAAFALARHGIARQDLPNVVIAPAGELRAALAGLPVEGLRLSRASLVLLHRLGLKRIGQLYPLPRAALESRFRETQKTSKGRGRQQHGGRRSPVSRQAVADAAVTVVRRLDQALGLEAEPIAPLLMPPVYRAERSYAEPLVSHDGILSALAELSSTVCSELAYRQEGARAVAFSLYRADGSSARIAAGTSRPVRESGHIVRLIEEKLGRVDAGLGIDCLTLEALRTERFDAEQTDLAGDHGRRVQAKPGDQRADEARAILIDRLVNRIGHDVVTWLAPHDSHIPERAQRYVPAIRGEPGGRDWQGVVAAGCERPRFLLKPAEPIAVVAEVPDGPPVRFTWRRVVRRIVRAEGPERIAPEWWHYLDTSSGNTASTAGQPPVNPVSCGMPGDDSKHALAAPACRVRDYYRIEDAYGGAYWVYRAGLYEGEADEAPPVWFIHGVA